MAHDEQAIGRAHSTGIDAVNAGDPVRLLTLMTGDAVFLNSGQAPVDGRRFLTRDAHTLSPAE
jgi:ketosteroid isomerase-like protein